MAVQYYKIGEAATLLNLKSYVLRFWETEFPDIVPLRTEKGQRLYTREHLALLQRIRYLLHDRGLTIDGARKVLVEEKQRGVTYLFREPGAPPDAAEDGTGASLALSFPLADHEDDRESAEEEVSDCEAAGAEYEGAPSAKAAGSGAKPSAQYNLPGLEELIAMRAAILDSGAGEAYSPGVAPAFPPSFGPRGMLPLFAQGRAPRCAGRASGHGGKNEGGGNFIHAEIPAAPRRAVAGGDPPGGFSDDFLRSLVRDLESVAALLRPGAFFEK